MKAPLINHGEERRRAEQEIRRHMDALRMVVDCLRDRHAPPKGELGGGPPASDLLERDLRPRFQIHSTPVHFWLLSTTERRFSLKNEKS
jgi:hypothetical protein